MDTPNPTDPEIEFTKKEIHDFGQKAREMENGIHNKCYEICHNLGNLLIDLGLPSSKNAYQVHQVWVGEENQENHYVIKISGKYIKNMSESKNVIIDLSLDQFSEENKNSGLVEVSWGKQNEIGPVNIYTENEAREKYGSIEDFL